MSDTVPKEPPHKSSFPLAAWMASLSVTTRISMANKQSSEHTSARASWNHFFLMPVKMVAGLSWPDLTSASPPPQDSPTLPHSGWHTPRKAPRGSKERGGRETKGRPGILLRCLLADIKTRTSNAAGVEHFPASEVITTLKSGTNMQPQEAGFSGSRTLGRNRRIWFREFNPHSVTCILEKLPAIIPCPPHSESLRPSSTETSVDTLTKVQFIRQGLPLSNMPPTFSRCKNPDTHTAQVAM